MGNIYKTDIQQTHHCNIRDICMPLGVSDCMLKHKNISFPTPWDLDLTGSQTHILNQRQGYNIQNDRPLISNVNLL